MNNSRIPASRIKPKKHIYHFALQCQDCKKIYRGRKVYEGYIDPEKLLDRLGWRKCPACKLRDIIKKCSDDIKEKKVL